MRSVSLLAFAALIFIVPSADAAPKKPKLKLCYSSEKIIAKQKCKPTETLVTPVNAAELFGVSPYGNGSAGDKVVTGAEDLDTESNRQYGDVTINEGASLIVPSGTVIRCTGIFHLAGTLYVSEGTDSRNFGDSGTLSSMLFPRFHTPSSGIGMAPAGIGGAGSSSAIRLGGGGGVGLSGIGQARGLIHPGSFGGGAGAANSGATAGQGGGSVTILCKLGIEITETGSVNAAGGVGAIGSGGGGGGVVILASAGSINHQGSIRVDGGIGGYNSGDPDHAAGGGGGGGLVQMLAPSIIDLGTVNISGGSGGPAYGAGTVNQPIFFGGGGGGPSAGDGGNGGSVNTNGSTTASEDGDDGYFIKSIQDPTSLF